MLCVADSGLVCVCQRPAGGTPLIHVVYPWDWFESVPPYLSSIFTVTLCEGKQIGVTSSSFYEEKLPWCPWCEGEFHAYAWDLCEQKSDGRWFGAVWWPARLYVKSHTGYQVWCACSWGYKGQVWFLRTDSYSLMGSTKNEAWNVPCKR